MSTERVFFVVLASFCEQSQNYLNYFCDFKAYLIVVVRVYTVLYVLQGNGCSCCKIYWILNSYSLMKLPNHNRILQTFPDAMHTVKDSIERVFFPFNWKEQVG